MLGKRHISSFPLETSWRRNGVGGGSFGWGVAAVTFLRGGSTFLMEKNRYVTLLYTVVTCGAQKTLVQNRLV